MAMSIEPVKLVPASAARCLDSSALGDGQEIAGKIVRIAVRGKIAFTLGAFETPRQRLLPYLATLDNGFLDRFRGFTAAHGRIDTKASTGIALFSLGIGKTMQYIQRNNPRGRLLQGLPEERHVVLLVTLQRHAEEFFLVAEGSVKTGLGDTHAVGQVSDGRAFIAFSPE